MFNHALPARSGIVCPEVTSPQAIKQTLAKKQEWFDQDQGSGPNQVKVMGSVEMAGADRGSVLLFAVLQADKRTDPPLSAPIINIRL